MLHLYNFFFYLLSPFLKIFLVIRAFKKKEDPKRYKEKLGYASISFKYNVIWFHVASLGEIKSIHKIIKHYQKNKKINLLITSVTTSSANYFERYLKNENTFHQYAPIDSPIIIDRFLKFWKPKFSVFVESEIWPNMIFKTSKKCKIILLNARISKNSFKKWKFLKPIFKKILVKFDFILPQSLEVVEMLKFFHFEKYKFIGNIKYTNIDTDPPNIIQINNNFKMWAAMSIHNNEINHIIKIHKNISSTEKNFLTFLIPRHLNEIENIVNKIQKQNIACQKISTKNKIDNFSGIVVVDKFGIADDIFNKVKIVFMGGSFINHGGQNPIEPAKFGCKILSGKNIFNFTEIYEELVNKKVAKIVNDQSELEQELLIYLNNKTILDNASSDYIEFSEKIYKKTIEFLDNYIH
jgi:3-deoxy-D-manno-octulosonic-acid transferase